MWEEEEQDCRTPAERKRDEEAENLRIANQLCDEAGVERYASTEEAVAESLLSETLNNRKTEKTDKTTPVAPMIGVE